MGSACGCLRCAEKSLFMVVSILVSTFPPCKVRKCVPCMTRSSGRLSRTLLRVRMPQSPLFILPRFEKSHPVPLLMGASIFTENPLAPGKGDCVSGVARLPKLLTESGDSSADRLRLKPIFSEYIAKYVPKGCDGKCIPCKSICGKGLCVVGRG